jgi:hypothetical protein
MKIIQPNLRGLLRRRLWQIVAVAVLVTVILLVFIILLDSAGSQPQPFQYILH